jgi:SAM-dependent methyltransferase
MAEGCIDSPMRLLRTAGKAEENPPPVDFYADQILPRITNVLLAGREFNRIRARVTSGLSGDVLEIGFGSGLNVPHYPTAVRRVQAVDPATVGRKLAAKRVAASPVPVEYVDLVRDRFPLDSQSIDHVLITWTLCTIPDVQAALREISRVLHSSGQLHFVEHGLSPDARVARWQDRLTPLQRCWAGGCHLNRPIDRLVMRAGFEMTRLENFYIKGPRFTSYMYEGLATKS